MKHLKYLFFILALLPCSCSDYLDIVPEGVPSIDNAFSNRTSAEKFLATCYSYLPKVENGSSTVGLWGSDEFSYISKSDGMYGARITPNCVEYAYGEQNSDNPILNFWDGGRGGNNLWIGIRDCNIFLENIHKPQDLQDFERDRWIGEVNFLKAYYHFYLLQLYGPIPIMDQNIDVNASIQSVRKYRDPFDDCVNYIVKTLDKAMENLPLVIDDQGLEMGRITAPIAAAIKAKVLLFAASPLMNGNPDYSEVKDNRGVAIFSQAYDKKKWSLAAQATKEAIDMAEEAGHALYTFDEQINISQFTRRCLSLSEAVTSRWNKEIIWGSTCATNSLQQFAMPKLSEKNKWHEAYSILAPTFKAIEGFYTSNGVPMKEDKSTFWQENNGSRYKTTTIKDEGFNKYALEIGGRTALMHLNRETRFYSYVAFDRGTYYNISLRDDSTNLYKLHFLKFEYSGKRNGDHSSTGYLPKKLCGYRTVLTDNNFSPYRYAFPIVRLADLYLMYAEALNESLETPTAECYHYIDKVRERAGLEGVVTSWKKYSMYPDKPTQKEGFREIVRQERLNELAFEGQRFWDLRRWKIFVDSKIYGWNINGEIPEEFYKKTIVRERTIPYTSKDFLWPIKIETIQRNPNLVQNPGW